jgi:predicted DNA-binding transcriptional regulator AlpA
MKKSIIAVNNNVESLLNEHDVSRITGLSVATVRRWRHVRHGGPRYIKIGSSVRYRPQDISAWLESQPFGGGVPKAGSMG